MGICVCRISPAAKRIGYTDLHSVTDAYKPHPYEPEANDRWHKRFVAPSERSWSKKPVSEQTNINVVWGKPAVGSQVYQVPFYDGAKKIYDADLDTKAVGEIVLDSRGKMTVQFYEGF